MRAAALAVLLLAACDAPTSTDVASPAPTTSASTDAAPVPPEAWGVKPSGEGIVVNGEFLAFRTLQEGVLAAMFRGADPQISSNEECGAGPMQFAEDGALLLNFQDGEFVGWFLDGRGSVPVETDRGITVGSQLERVEATYGAVAVEESTLGEEFMSESGVAGFLAEGEGGKVVESLYAGTNSFFR